MKKGLPGKFLIISFLFLLVSFTGFGFASGANADSVRLDRQAGKYYIIHKVDPKETLFSLSRRYHVSIEDILINNPSAREGLKFEAILKIPHVKKSADPGKAMHTVQNGETLFSISRLYNTSVDQIAQINELDGYAIKVGQRLVIPESQTQEMTAGTQPEDQSGHHIVEAGETLFSISKKYQTRPDQIKIWNNLESADVQIGQQLIVRKPAGVEKPEENALAIRNPEPVNESGLSASVEPPVAVNKFKIEDNPYEKDKTLKRSGESVKIEKVHEIGLAEAIEGTNETKKYLALHKTATPGTILQVRNEMNDLTVFVRVIGKLPDTGENKKLVIKMSKIAYEHLGAIDDRFPVEISYIP